MALTAASLSSLSEAASELVRLGANFYQRGWMLGTSGNLSAVISRAGEPALRLAITGSSIDKGRMDSTQIIEVDESGSVVGSSSLRPSAETLVHLQIARTVGALAVFHTHSVWATVLSDHHRRMQGLWIEGYEMLKGLEGVDTHQHREWLPILDNTQDMTALAAEAKNVLSGKPDIHGFLVHRHGLYTWGRSLQSAARHVEILEFLLEAEGRRQTMTPIVQ